MLWQSRRQATEPVPPVARGEGWYLGPEEKRDTAGRPWWTELKVGSSICEHQEIPEAITEKRTPQTSKTATDTATLHLHLSPPWIHPAAPHQAWLHFLWCVSGFWVRGSCGCYFHLPAETDFRKIFCWCCSLADGNLDWNSLRGLISDCSNNKFHV